MADVPRQETPSIPAGGVVPVIRQIAAERRKVNSQGWSAAQPLAASRNPKKPRSGATIARLSCRYPAWAKRF